MQASLASGQRKLAWARGHMPVHAWLRRHLGPDRPLAGQRVAVCSHLEAKTGVMIETLAALGADDVVFTASVSATTQDDVVAALSAQGGITGYARRDCPEAELAELHGRTLAHEPTLILDDGAELTARLLAMRPALAERLLGVCEQTTTGVQRLRAMAGEGRLGFPALAVNDTPMKRAFDNVHGTGESTLVNICAATNLLLAGKRVVVAGFGSCGRGLAEKARGANARVMVTEVEPRRALTAWMAGFDVAPMNQAAPWGELFITATGCPGVLGAGHFGRMRDGVVLSNAGHFDVEIDQAALSCMASAETEVRDGVTEYRMGDGRRIHLVAKGQLANLATPGAMGHPVEVMDQTFGVQVCAALFLARSGHALGAGVQPVPDEVDREVAQIRLASLGIEIDSLNDVQRAHRQAWLAQDVKKAR